MSNYIIKYTQFTDGNFNIDSMLNHPFLHDISIVNREKCPPTDVVDIHGKFDTVHKTVDVHVLNINIFTIRFIFISFDDFHSKMFWDLLISFQPFRQKPNFISRI